MVNLQWAVRGGGDAGHFVLASQTTQCSSGKSGLAREIFNWQWYPWSLAPPSFQPPSNISPTTRASPDGASTICIPRWVAHTLGRMTWHDSGIFGWSSEFMDINNDYLTFQNCECVWCAMFFSLHIQQREETAANWDCRQPGRNDAE